MAETIHLAIPVDGDAYRFYAEVTAESARRGSSLPVEVHFIDWTKIDRARLERLGSWHGSAIAYSRLFLPEIFPELDWIISCDADMMFRGDIADLLKLRDDSVAILAGKDCPLPPHPYTEEHINWYKDKGLLLKDPYAYFCDGLCLCNLKKWRELNVSQRAEELALRYKDWPSPDQMILNYLLQDDKKLLPRQWGCFSGDENADVDWSKSGAVHFVEDPPWNRYKVTHLMSDLVMEWWKVAESCKLNVEGCGLKVEGYRGCRNWFDYAWRRAAFGFLKHNQWILKLHPKLWLHLRNTRGVRM